MLLVKNSRLSKSLVGISLTLSLLTPGTVLLGLNQLMLQLILRQPHLIVLRARAKQAVLCARHEPISEKCVTNLALEIRHV